MGTPGQDQQPQHQPQQTTITQLRGPDRADSDDQQIRTQPQRLTNTKLVDLLLKTSTERIHASLALAKGRELIASQEVAATIAELGYFAGQPVAWASIADTVTDFVGSVHFVEKLASDPTRRDLAMRMSMFESMVKHGDSKLATTVANRSSISGVSIPEVASVDRSAVANELLLAAHASVDKALKIARTAEAAVDAETFSTACEPLPHHMYAAWRSALALLPDERIASCAGHVTELANRLDLLHQKLVATPTVPWRRRIASVFDLEGDLLASIGLPSRTRRYSGKVDPNEAIKAVQAAGSQPADTKDFRGDTPQIAVNKIGVGIKYVIARQQKSLVDLTAALAEPKHVAPPSRIEMLLTTLGMAVLNSATGALGGLVASKLKTLFDAKAPAVLGPDLSSARDDIKKLHDAVSLPSVTPAPVMTPGMQAATIEVAKNATKDLFKGLVGVMTTTQSNVDLTVPKNAYIAHTGNLLIEAAHRLELQFASIAPALAQLDLEILNDLSEYINITMQPLAQDAMYDESMRGWQRFKVENELTAEGSKGHVYASQAGVLTARVTIPNEKRLLGMPVVTGLHLVNDEAAAVRQLRSHPRPLGRVGIYETYEVVFSSTKGHTMVELSIGPDGLVRTTSSTDTNAWTAFGAGMPVRPTEAGDLVSDWSTVTFPTKQPPDPAQAIEGMNAVLAALAQVSTASIKES